MYDVSLHTAPFSLPEQKVFRRLQEEATMTIVAVNGGGNTPNGEAATDRSDGTYVLTSSHTAQDDSFNFDQITTDTQTKFENSHLAFWGTTAFEDAEATLTSEQGDDTAAIAGIVIASTSDNNRVSSDGTDSLLIA